MILFNGDSFDESEEHFPNDPTQDQIRQRAAAIRKRWSVRQRKSRRVTPTRNWLPPIIGIDDVEANLSSARN